MSKTIVVTGGAGFIGQHLCRRLLQQKHHVICVDNFYTSQKNSLPSHAQLTVIEHDITEPLLLNQEIAEIYHLACPASPVHYQRDPIYTARTNFIGTMHMLELAKQKNARLVQASTSEIYGDPLVHPQSENYYGNVNVTNTRACYDEGKRLAETLCYDFARHYQLSVGVARIFNTYGQGMLPDDGRVISNFMMQACLQKPITIYGDGLQTRSFCYVDDMVDGLIALMAATNVQGPVNLGNPEEFTIQELAEKILALAGSKSTLQYLPLPQGDPKQRKPDITLAKTQLGFKPKIQLAEGLVQTIQYFKDVIKSHHFSTLS